MQLNWVNSQPHKHKILVAGNHDLLLDPAFVDAFPQRILERPRTSREDLEWGDVVYLNNTSVKLQFGNQMQETVREVNIYGSPQTVQYGTWAFQGPPNRDVWTTKLSLKPDILLTHGPLKGYLDLNELGCGFLLKEIWRVRPKLMVFGHIHGGYGKKVVRLDRVQKIYDGVRPGERGSMAVVGLALLLI